MKKLFETVDTDLTLVCDNPACGYIQEEKVAPDNARLWINTPCPNCTENLLTLEDYNNWKTFQKTIRVLNKYFSWITLFFPKNPETVDVEVHFHRNVKMRVVHPEKEID